MDCSDDQEDVEGSMGNVAPLEQSGTFKSRHQKGRNNCGKGNQGALCRRSTSKNGVEIQHALEKAAAQDIIW